MVLEELASFWSSRLRNFGTNFQPIRVSRAFMLTRISLFLFSHSLCSTMNTASSLQISHVSVCQQVSQKAGPRHKVLCSAPVLAVRSFLPLASPCPLDTMLVGVKDLSEQR